MATPLIRDGWEVFFLRIFSLFIFSGTDFALFFTLFPYLCKRFPEAAHLSGMYRACIGDVSVMYRKIASDDRRDGGG